MVKYLYMPFTFSLAMANLYAMDNTQQQTWDGKEYHDNSSKQFQAAMQIVEPLELSNEHILEIGCGSGRVTRVLAQKAAQGSILATDVQESMVVKAKEYCGDLPNVSFEVVDAHKLPYKDRFTRIFSFTALHWMENQAAVLKGCYNALRPGVRYYLPCLAK